MEDLLGWKSRRAGLGRWNVWCVYVSTRAYRCHSCVRRSTKGVLTSSEVAAAMRMVLAVDSSRGAYLHHCNVAYSEYGILVTVAFWSCSFDWAACEVSYEGSWWDRDESFGVARGALYRRFDRFRGFWDCCVFIHFLESFHLFVRFISLVSWD